MPKRIPVAEGFVARRTARGISPNAVLFRAWDLQAPPSLDDA